MYRNQTFIPTPTSASGLIYLGAARQEQLAHLRLLCANRTRDNPAAELTGSLWLRDHDLVLVDRLRVPAVHEWFGWTDAQVCQGRDAPHSAEVRGAWVPPFTLLLRAAACLAEQVSADPERGTDWVRAGTVIAIGRNVWPWGNGRVAGRPDESAVSHRRMVLVDADAPAQRLWAADLALRSGAFGVVIADGTGLDLASTRRLQLACESGRTACVLARPPWEEQELSAAFSRWRVQPVPGEHTQPQRGPRVGRVVQRWSIDLLRCKGLRPTDLPAWSWHVEEDHAAGACRLVADVLDGPDSQIDAARKWLGGVG